MMKKLIAVAALLLASSVAYSAGGKTSWGYSGEEAAEHWGKLSEEYKFCSDGKNQSPINIKKTVKVKKKALPKIQFSYKAGTTEIKNNGHTVQVDYAPGSKISLRGHDFELKQFHFHSPSENQIQSFSYPMEVHFVHADKNGNLAVIGIMILEGKENPTLAKIWPSMPLKEGEATLPKRVNIRSILPKKRNYYRFDGSLTTPPCSEGVRWLVLKRGITASKAQIQKFRKAMHDQDTNRPLQPINARIIAEQP